jgi:hypothetical protein
VCQNATQAEGSDLVFGFFFAIGCPVVTCARMPRRLRIEHERAIYHVMARSNARQDIVSDDEDRRRLLADLERAVTRSGWELFCFAPDRRLPAT